MSADNIGKPIYRSGPNLKSTCKCNMVTSDYGSPQKLQVKCRWKSYGAQLSCRPTAALVFPVCVFGHGWRRKHKATVKGSEKEAVSLQAATVEHHRLWGGNQSELECGFMPSAVKFNSLCLAPPPSPHPLFSTGDFWCPAYQPLIPHQQKRRMPWDLLNPHDELSREPSASLSEPPCSPDVVPDWLNYGRYTPPPWECVCLCMSCGRYADTQMHLVLLNLMSIFTPSGRLQHLI